MESKRYLSLDIVRGVAALSVMLSHVAVWGRALTGSDFLDRPFKYAVRLFDITLHGGAFGRPTGSHPGVIAFIVLSGFCIHLPVAQRPDMVGKAGFWSQYAARRFFRIAPVYWVASIVGILVVAITLHHPNLEVPDVAYAPNGIRPTDVALKLTFASAFANEDRTELGNAPLHTVTAEAVLYACYPAVLFLARRRGWPAAFALAAAAYVVSLPMVLDRFLDHSTLNETFARFLLYWTMGAFAADHFVRHRLAASTRRAWIATAVAYAVYFLVANSIYVRGAYLVKAPLFSVFVTLLLYAMMLREHVGSLRPHPLARLLAAIGERSYSLYAIHTPVIAIVFMVFVAYPINPAYQRIATLLCIPVATYLLYRLVELPSHDLAKRAAARLKPKPELLVPT